MSNTPHIAVPAIGNPIPPPLRAIATTSPTTPNAKPRSRIGSATNGRHNVNKPTMARTIEPMPRLFDGLLEATLI
jgi:hypothetical protein